MKRLLTTIFVLAVFAMSAAIAKAQRNPRSSATLNLKGARVVVEYGRPALRGRTAAQMLERLQPGQVWRLGADQSTTFSTTAALNFGDVAIPKGDYSIWARKESDNSWKLVFNKQHGQWGTEHDPAQDVAAVPLKHSKASKPEEMVTLALAKQDDGGVFTIHWGDLELSTEFKTK